MSGFVCPSCKCESQLFNPTSGGAKKMCEDFQCPLLAKIPLDPKIQVLLDKG
jgi:Mrp family chromosome partitioning ATPase